jgi:hypothetical protein
MSKIKRPTIVAYISEFQPRANPTTSEFTTTTPALQLAKV